MSTTTTARPTVPGSHHPLDDRHLVLSATALVENLRHHHIHPEMEPALVERWMRDIALELQRRRAALQDDGKPCQRRDESEEGNTAMKTLPFADHGVSEDELLRLIQEEAINQWKRQEPSTLPVIATEAKPTSTSLFLSKLGAGGALQSLMSWNRILEESEDKDEVKIQMLKQVQHIQDILPDWETEVRPFLLQALRTERIRECLQLHRLWFDRTRHSTEFRRLQIDLCENLLSLMSEYSTSGTSPSHMNEVVDLSLDMFEDWMLRGLYVHDNRVWSIGQSMWRILLQGTTIVDEKVSLTPITQSIVMVDQQATWFSSWLAHLSPDQSRKLAMEASGILPAILQWCDSKPPQSISSSNIDIGCYWLTIVCDILQSTRSSRFPWDDIIPSVPDRKSYLLNLFLQRMMMDEDSGRFMMCVDAVETILSGCRGDDEEITRNALMAQVKNTLQQGQDSLRQRRLWQMIQRVE